MRLHCKIEFCDGEQEETHISHTFTHVVNNQEDCAPKYV